MSSPKMVLVTGAAGQLGATLQVESNKFEGLEWVFMDSHQLDITDKKQVEEVLNSKDFDFCINCAAFTNVEQAEMDPKKAMAVNFEGVKNIVDTIKDKDTVLIHLSTDYVFDGMKKVAYQESDDTNPINEYGKSKLLGENYIVEQLKRYYIVRTSWLFSGFSSNFYTFIRSKLKENDKIRVISSQTGAPTSTIDLSHGLIKMIQTEEKNYGIFHFSNSGLTNWYIFAKEIIRSLDPKKMDQLTEIDSFKSQAKRPNNSKLDSSRFERVFDHEIPHWKDALTRVIENH